MGCLMAEIASAYVPKVLQCGGASTARMSTVKFEINPPSTLTGDHPRGHLRVPCGDTSSRTLFNVLALGLRKSGGRCQSCSLSDSRAVSASLCNTGRAAARHGLPCKRLRSLNTSVHACRVSMGHSSRLGLSSAPIHLCVGEHSPSCLALHQVAAAPNALCS